MKIQDLICGLCILCMACTKTEILTYEKARATCKMNGFVKQPNGDSVLTAYGPDCIKGALLPTVHATTLDGIEIDSSYFENKVNVINFWFIGCHPCEAEMPGLNKLVEKYKSQPVNFLALSINSPKDVKEYMVDNPFHFEQVPYAQPVIEGNFQHIWGYPCNIVTDRNKKIIYVETGGPSDSTAIARIQSELIPVINEALKG